MTQQHKQTDKPKQKYTRKNTTSTKRPSINVERKPLDDNESSLKELVVLWETEESQKGATFRFLRKTYNDLAAAKLVRQM